MKYILLTLCLTTSANLWNVNLYPHTLSFEMRINLPQKQTWTSTISKRQVARFRPIYDNQQNKIMDIKCHNRFQYSIVYQVFLLSYLTTKSEIQKFENLSYYVEISFNGHSKNWQNKCGRYENSIYLTNENFIDQSFIKSCIINAFS